MPLEKFLALRDGVTDRAAQATTLLCGEFRLDRHLAMPAIRALPSVLHLRATETLRRSALTDTLRLLRAEVETTNFCNQIVVRSLISALFVYFMRNWAETAAAHGDWFSAVRAPHTARALARMHEAPEKPWALESSGKRGRSLARVCAAVQFDGWGTAPQISDALADGNRFPSARLPARVGYEFRVLLQSRVQAMRGISPMSYRSSANPNETSKPSGKARTGRREHFEPRGSVLNPLGSRLLRRPGPSATSGARRSFKPWATGSRPPFHSARTRCRAFCSQVESPGVAQMRRGETAFCSQVNHLASTNAARGNCILQPGGITRRRTNAARGNCILQPGGITWRRTNAARENCIFQSAACRLLLQIVCICNKNIRHGRWHHLVTGRNQQARIALWGARRGRRHHHLRHACGARANDP